MGITYSASGMNLAGLEFAGEAACEGGTGPMAPIHHYPLLCWTHLGHDKYGDQVFTEDGKASVGQIAAAVAEKPSAAALASQFGTTEEHVVQALDYAIEAGILVEKG